MYFMRFCGGSSLLHYVDGREKSHRIEHRHFDLRLAYQGVVVGERGKESVGSVGKKCPVNQRCRVAWSFAPNRNSPMP